MRTLKYAILGLLNQRDMSGYELMKQFESGLNEFWSAKHSQIYPELAKLTEEGSVDYQVQISGSVLQKKVYSITEAGRKDFLAWLKKDVAMEPTPKEVFRLKLFFADCLDAATLLAHLESQLRQHEDRLTHLKNNQKKFTEVPPADSDGFGDYLVLMGAVMREETSCEWLKKCLALCRK